MRVPDRLPPPEALVESTSPLGPMRAVIRTVPRMFGSPPDSSRL